jgi:hypothetical protein
LSGITYKAIHVYNATAGQYEAICSTGVSVLQHNTSGTPSSATVLAPFQSFWVKTQSGGPATVTLSNTQRTTSMTGVGTFMKNGFDLARINLFDKDSSRDQVVFYFQDGASQDFNPEFDALKMKSMEASAPSLYSIGQDGDLSINALSPQETEYALPLGFRSNKTGKNSISLNKESLDAKWFVYLEDKHLGSFFDLKKDDYVFNHTGSNTDSRFVLHFTQSPLSTDKLISSVQKMNIGGDGEFVYVYIPSHFADQSYGIEVFDFSGKQVYTTNKGELKHGMNTLSFPVDNAGYYVVRVIAGEENLSGKVFLR